MSDSVKEQLSAYLDGALAEAELELLAKRTARDAELRDALSRYTLISECLKGERPAAVSRDFAANVMAALEQEPANAARPAMSQALLRRLRPVAGFAVAAGVAAVAVLTVQQGGVAPSMVADNQVETAPTQMLALDAEPSYTVPTSTGQPSAFVPAARLTNYVVAHSEYSSPLGRRTVLSGVLSEDELVSADEPADDEAAVETQVTNP
jgi:sigma-E factor negative regulatory protein RseA